MICAIPSDFNIELPICFQNEDIELEARRFMIALASKTYILLSFLYWVKAPGGMILMRFCSKRLKTNKAIYMLTAQLQDRNHVKYDSTFYINIKQFYRVLCKTCFYFEVY